MASSLTAAQRLVVFDILDVPNATTYTAVDGMGMTFANTSQTLATLAKTQIDNYLDETIPARPDCAAIESDIKRLINEWTDIRDRFGSVVQGGTPDAQGMNFSWEPKRASIHAQFIRRVPFPKYHEVLAKQQGTSSGGISSVQILR